jgi:copper chaperone CopZ
VNPATSSPSASSIQSAINSALSADLDGATASVVEVTTDVPAGDRIFTITFSGGSPGAMLRAADGTSELVGPADNGKLSGNATFEVEVFNRPTVTVLTTTDGGESPSAVIETLTSRSATASIETIANGGDAQIETLIDSDSITISEITAGGTGSDEVQEISIDADGGSFTLTLTDTGSSIYGGVAQTTTSIDFDPSDLNQVALDIRDALEALTGIEEVTVSRASSDFTITFTDPSDTNLDLLSANVNETQELTVNATDGSLTLTLEDPGINGGTPQTTGAITIDSEDLDQVALDIASALTGFNGITAVDVTRDESVFTITFTNPANTNLNELSVNINETQELSIDATGGAFTLTLNDPDINEGDAQTTSPITFNPGNLSQVATDIATQLNAFTDIVGVSVSNNGSVFTIVFTDPANTDLARLSVDQSQLINTPNASAEITTINEGGTATGDETQVLRINADSGTFTLSYDNGTTVETSGSLDISTMTNVDLETAVKTITGATNVTVVKDANNFIYFITFDTPGNTDYAQLSVNSSGLILNEIQELSIEANGGTFDISYGGSTETNLDYDITDTLLATKIGNITGSSVTVVQDGTSYTITFDGSGLENTDVRKLVVDDSNLRLNETQVLTLHGC